ncbi:VOC family protein [Glaciimonas sp. PAMC28666]|uniref:VOC family protein n=1 Tax=Glaciimonas sp. PAMC28666 TaxID=2807626 RepID=UPI0019623DC1|nr:VOC family protein [Glaciimonas sp. PAMC28666]QRX81734.1 VOC family protein [Glaciimonas sp. PAMC28666]
MSILTAPARRPDVLSVHSINEFVYSVPDLKEAEHFYRSFGLDVRVEADCLALYTFGHPHRWARIFEGEGERKRLLWVTWGIYADDQEAFDRQLDAHHVVRTTAPQRAAADGIWFLGPDGLPQQLQVCEKTSPDIKSPRIFPPEISISGRAPHRSEVTQVRPNRLSHILLFTADVNASAKFYIEVLGLRMSDRSGSIIAFLHSPHGSDHHLIAFAMSADYGLHHSSWDVSSFDAVGLGSGQMTQAGYPDGWGLGRHVLGSNYFRYVRDPWGSYCEYSFDIDHIAADLDWPADDWLPEDALYVWGAPPPEDFIKNYEIA